MIGNKFTSEELYCHITSRAQNSPVYQEKEWFTTEDLRDMGVFFRKSVMRKAQKAGDKKVLKQGNGRWLVHKDFINTLHSQSLDCTKDLQRSCESFATEKYYPHLLTPEFLSFFEKEKHKSKF